MLDRHIEALAMLETAGGKKTIKGPNGEDSFNAWNIKDFSGNGFRALDKAEGSRDAYRVYGSPEEAKADLIGLLQRKYPKALVANTPEEFFGALKAGGYATDPMYVAKGVSVAKRLGAPMAAQTQTAQPAPDLNAFADAGWGSEIEFAKSKGISDDKILAKLQGEQVKLRAQQQSVGETVRTGLATGAHSSQIIAQMRQAGLGDEIDFAKSKGISEDKIIEKLAPLAAEQGRAARSRLDADGAIVTGVKSAGDTGSGLLRGARQAYNQVTGDEAMVKRLQAEEAAARSDLDRVARESTTAGTVGGVAPYLAAALIPGGQTVLGGAAIGAGIGMAQPTVEGESRLSNTALGAVGGGGANAVFKGLGLAGRVAERSGRVDDEALTLLQREGITPSRGMVSGPAGMLSRIAERVPGAKLGVRDAEEALQSQTQNAIVKRMGAAGGELSSDAINAAENLNRARYAAAYGDTQVTVSDKLRGTLIDGLRAQINGANPMVRNELVAMFGDDLARLENGGTISAKTLGALRSQLGSDGRSATLSAAEKQAYGRTRQAVTDTLEQGLPPAQLKALREANNFHANIQVGKDIVAKMKDDPNRDVAKALEQAVTAAKNKSDVVHGEATLQDLQKALSGLQRPKGTLGGMLSENTTDLVQVLGALHTGGASLLAGVPANVALRLLNSQAPEVRAAVATLNPVVKAELMKKAVAAQISGGLTQ